MKRLDVLFVDVEETRTLLQPGIREARMHRRGGDKSNALFSEKQQNLTSKRKNYARRGHVLRFEMKFA